MCVNVIKKFQKQYILIVVQDISRVIKCQWQKDSNMCAYVWTKPLAPVYVSHLKPHLGSSTKFNNVAKISIKYPYLQRKHWYCFGDGSPLQDTNQCMTLLCRSGYFMQFLTKFFGIDTTSPWAWTFHLIPRKRLFLKWVNVGFQIPNISLLGIACNIQICTEKSCMEPYLYHLG